MRKGSGMGKISKPLWLEICGVILTPIVIAGASYYVTVRVNEQQQANAERIAKAQINNAIRISEGEVKVAQLNQIKDLFTQIFIEKPDLPKREIILSLSAYGMTSLPFLTHSLDYAKEKKDEDLIQTSEEAIRIALGSTQINLKAVHLDGKSLRNATLKNLDLESADFQKSNLYNANLSYCNLVGAKFAHADLYLTDFTNANLTDADLSHANLRRANFKMAKLDKANFKNSRNVEDAEFTPASLKDADFSKDDIIKLLKKYKGEIEQDRYGENLFAKLREKYSLKPEEI